MSRDLFVVTYEDAVKAAGHSCPTASGAYRIAQPGLDALYPDSHPVRSEVEVLAAGPCDDVTCGVMSREIFNMNHRRFPASTPSF